jgi:hypothetical protein
MRTKRCQGRYILLSKCVICNIVGVVLRPRGKNDPHICFELISEDDECWFPYSGSGSSSFWFDCYTAVLAAARTWCEKEALPDMVGEHDNNMKRQYGWKFKKET